MMVIQSLLIALARAVQNEGMKNRIRGDMAHIAEQKRPHSLRKIVSALSVGPHLVLQHGGIHIGRFRQNRKSIPAAGAMQKHRRFLKPWGFRAVQIIEQKIRSHRTEKKNIFVPLKKLCQKGSFKTGKNLSGKPPVGYFFWHGIPCWSTIPRTPKSAFRRPPG